MMRYPLRSVLPSRRLFAALRTVAAAGVIAAGAAGCDANGPAATGPAAAASGALAASAASDAPAVRSDAPVVVDGQPQTRAQVYEGVKQMTELGRQIFFDPSLSGSGKLACASCHSPQHGFSAPNALAAQFGGDDMRQQGFRSVPTLKYLQAVPKFSEHYHESDDEGDESVDAGPTGGLTWDGRADSGAQQARAPLTSPFEMNSTPAKVARAVRAAPYAQAFRTAFGAQVFNDDAATFAAVLKALETFEQKPEVFYPYTSKYDAYLAGHATLTDAELRGLKVFNDETKGNCASCHVSKRGLDGTPPQFSDFGLIALGVPRNRELAVNRNPKFYDLGACGPERQDLKGRDEFCGLFRTPTLRNVVLKKSFFHNGIYHSLEDVLRFYSERDTNPEKFYPVKHGVVQKFDDLPKRYWKNLNDEAPFDRKRGDAPVLTDAEIQDVIAFLGTLTDGYDPHAPAAHGGH
ncbi:cytochrome-c peroxidase [Burkholderia singularis]|uniref:cytochrome-c peroxidase n=1 Tax=Burkholderia singularis TaxID=1503053 RepID=UPI0026A89353